MGYTLFFIELICFLAGCLLWRKNWLPQYKMLVLLMGLTVLVDRVAYILNIRYHLNVWLFNFFSPLEACAYICFFYLESVHPAMRRLYRCLLAAMVPALLITWLIQPHLFIFNQYGYIAGLFLLLLAAASFFIEDMLSRTDGNLTLHPAFWLAAGAIPFCCIHILLFALLFYVVKIPLRYFACVNTIANLFLYVGVTGCFFTINRAAHRRGNPAVNRG